MQILYDPFLDSESVIGLHFPGICAALTQIFRFIHHSRMFSQWRYTFVLHIAKVCIPWYAATSSKILM